MSEKLLSIIVPSYNMEKYLHKCLSSLIIEPEKMNKLDVIVVNDGSTDRTSEIAHEFADRYPEIFSVIDKQNGHYGSCVNAGLKIAKGIYVKTLDADDWYDSHGLVELINTISKVDYKNIDLVISEVRRVYSDGSPNVETNLKLPVDEIFDVSCLPNPRKAIMGQAMLAFKTENVRRIGYVQTPGVPHTDAEWMTIPWVTVRRIVYCPAVVYVVLNGRLGQSMDAKTYSNNFSIVLSLVKGMLKNYANWLVGANCDRKTTLFAEEKLLFMIDHIYNVCLFGFGGYYPSVNLESFDSELKEKYNSYYDKVSVKAKIFGICLDALHLWRTNKVGFASIKGMLYIENMLKTPVRPLCRLLKRMFNV